MKKIAAFISVVGAIVLVIAVFQKQQMSSEVALRSLRSDFEDLSARMSEIERAQRQAAAPAPVVGEKQSDSDQLTTLKTDVAKLQSTIARLEDIQSTISNEIASARGANVPFIYPNSTKRTDYAFSGYTSPEAGFQSVLWAITQADSKAFLQSLSGPVAEAFAKQFEDVPEGVMPGGFKNGAMFKATGFHILEQTPLPEDEVLLKVFLEGARVTVKPVFKRVGAEWKWTRNDG